MITKSNFQFLSLRSQPFNLNLLTLNSGSQLPPSPFKNEVRGIQHFSQMDVWIYDIPFLYMVVDSQ